MEMGCVIPAKDEARFIENTIRAIRNQKVVPDPIIVIDDHSKDRTKIIARKAGARVIDGPVHKSKSRTIRICETINSGLRQLSPDFDFIIIIGADSIISNNWVNKLMDRMLANEKLVIASGMVEGGRVSRFLPRGTRMIRGKWWYNDWNNDGLYKEVYGWEHLPIYHAKYHGFETRQFTDILVHPQRKPGKDTDWSDRGKAMKRIGQNMIQVVFRAYRLALFEGNIQGASRLLNSYLEYDAEPESWARKFQKRVTRYRISEFLFSGGPFLDAKNL